ncbi:MAG: hypothetical protein GC164_15640 [Phycisphaera sp.]|nr:hypothetical protein [Phycisphaera sp.]
MRTKLLLLSLAFTVLAVALLTRRQQRIELSNQIARFHHEIDRARQETWDLQTRIAQASESRRLIRSLREQGLDLEPLTAPDPRSPVNDLEQNPLKKVFLENVGQNGNPQIP